MELKISLSRRKKNEVITDKRKTRIYIATNSGKIVPYAKLREAIQKSSNQLVEQEAQISTGDDLASRPYSMESFLSLYENNVTFYRCVNQIAIDAVGQGWRLEKREGTKSDDGEREKIENLLRKCNETEGDPIRKILQSCLVDYGSVGNAAIEVVRNAKNEIAELYHMEGHTIWVGKPRNKEYGIERYCQIRNSHKRWFKRYGLNDIQIHPESGDRADFLDFKSRANELIFWHTYYPRNSYYGVPNILPATGSVIGLMGAQDFNVSFFENYGIPAYMIVLKGDWEDGAEKSIGKFLDTEIKGSSNAHRTMVFGVEDGDDIELHRLSVDTKEGSFRVYHDVWREEVLSAYSMPPYRIGIPEHGRLGGNLAEEATAIYKQSVIEPIQNDIEDIINIKIIQEGLGCNTWIWRLNDLDIRDVNKETERLAVLHDHGAVTPNEIRNVLDLGEPYKDGDNYTQKNADSTIASNAAILAGIAASSAAS